MATLQSLAGLDFYQSGLNLSEVNQVRGDSMELWLSKLTFGSSRPSIVTVTASADAATDAETIAATISTPTVLYRRDVLWFSAAGVLAVVKETVNLGGTGTGLSLTAVLGTGGNAQKVVSVTINNGGSGYVTAPTLAFTGGAGSGATATCTVVDGVVTSVTVTAQGSGYTSVPTVAITAATNNSVKVLPLSGPITSGGTAKTYGLKPLISLMEGGVVDRQGQEMTSRVKAQSLYEVKGINKRSATMPLNGVVLKNDPALFDIEDVVGGSQLLYVESRHSPFQVFDNGGTIYDKGRGVGATGAIGTILNFQLTAPEADYVKFQASLSISGSPTPYALLV